MNTELLVLKSKLRGLELSSRKFREKISKSAGDRRWNLRFRKMALGSHTREHLIAYGLIREVPYSKIEGKCATGNEPSPNTILNIIQAHVPYREKSKWSLDRVNQLLNRDEK